ncbi:hypothetical protein ABIB95_007454 [Bradyrhizobium sp. LA2.1]
MFPARNTALFLFGRRRRAIGLAGVALCHDVLIARTLARARRRLGVAFLAACLPPMSGLPSRSFSRGIWVNALPRHWFAMPMPCCACERVHRIVAVCSARSCAGPGVSNNGWTWLDAETIGRLDHFDLRAAGGGRVGPARGTQHCVRPASAVPQPDGRSAVATRATDTISASIDLQPELGTAARLPLSSGQNDKAVTL